MSLDELKGLAYIEPNTIDRLSVHGPVHLKQRGEQLLAEIVFLTHRDVVKHIGFENVQAGVDHVAEGLSWAWFLQKFANVAAA